MLRSQPDEATRRFRIANLQKGHSLTKKCNEPEKDTSPEEPASLVGARRNLAFQVLLGAAGRENVDNPHRPATLSAGQRQGRIGPEPGAFQAAAAGQAKPNEPEFGPCRASSNAGNSTRSSLGPARGPCNNQHAGYYTHTSFGVIGRS